MNSSTRMVKEVLKRTILATCGPRLTKTLRRVYTVHQIVHDRHPREPEMALIRSFVSSGNTVADIGANVGVYTKELALAAGPEGKVYSFEPLLENYDILTALLRKGRMDNVIPTRAALGSSVTKWEIVIPEMDGFLGLYWAHLAKPGDRGRREMVEVLTLDELVKRGVFTHVDFIKCDVEGGELEVLRGGISLIRSSRPTWLMEVSRATSSQVFAFFSELGYQAFVYSGRLIPVDGYRDGSFSNYFFVHRQSKRAGDLQ